MDKIEQDIEHLLGVIANSSVRPVILLGAGASVKSGIPATGQFVEKAAAWVYARRKQLSMDDVRITRSDWLPFLESQTWYNASKSPSDNYPVVFKHLLTPRELRRDFYRMILSPKIPPSIGYRALTDLVAKKRFDTILTTNFDSILKQSFAIDERIHLVDEIKSQSDYSKISSSPKNVQIIHLHGDVDNYTDKNSIDEIQELNKEFIQRLMPLLSDHPLIVVGYRGYENSIMKTLFIDNAEYATNYKHGIYWCILDNDNLAEIPENLQQLHSLIGANLQFVRIKDFDTLFEVNIRKGIKPEYKLSYSKGDGGAQNIFDLRAAPNAQFSDLDIAFLKQRLVKYCEVMRIPVKSPLNDEELKQILLERDLLADQSGQLVPTNSGLLLFGKSPSSIFEHAVIRVITKDHDNFLRDNFLNNSEELQEEYFVKGNLWTQLNEVIEIVSVFNKPFKLKGEFSSTVTPYPPLAIKELLTNCIVHRDYENTNQTIIEITPKYIKIVNCGGLVDDVQDKLEGLPIEEVIRSGGKGIKGYRNPVMADLFYGTETMEKRGSGLSDVFAEAQRFSSYVKFGPSEANDYFEATISARPEVIDQVTNTAKHAEQFVERYSSNISEFTHVPQHIYITETIVSKIEILESLSFETSPSFVYWDGKLLTFFDPTRRQFGFSSFVDAGTMECLQVDEFCDNLDGRRKFIELLNLTFMAHLSYLGLRIDKEKKRAYFSRDLRREDNVQIRYQARVKAATRTVVKKRVSQSTGKIVYWEHKSFSFRIERFGESLGLVIIPNYSFTIDGISTYIKADRINKLSTKRASRDYNMHYLNDLSFWKWVIANGGKQNTIIRFLPEEIMKELPEDQFMVLDGEFVKASHLTSEMFEDYLDIDSDDEEDVYADVDQIALDDNSETFENEE